MYEILFKFGLPIFLIVGGLYILFTGKARSSGLMFPWLTILRIIFTKQERSFAYPPIAARIMALLIILIGIIWLISGFFYSF